MRLFLIVRIISALAIVAIVVFIGLTGCSGPEPEPEPSNLMKSFNEVQEKYINTAVQYQALVVSYNSTQARADRLADENYNLKLTVSRLQNEASTANTLVAHYASIAQESSQSSKAMREGLETEMEHSRHLQERYDDLRAKIEKVNNRTDNTTSSNLTAEKRVVFYEMWDLWWPTVGH